MVLEDSVCLFVNSDGPDLRSFFTFLSSFSSPAPNSESGCFIETWFYLR